MRKKALIIAYYFPPVGGGGVQRSAKFVRYLPDFGWAPVVLTIKKPAYAAFDETMLRELPADLPVYRAPALQPTAIYFAKKRESQQKADTDKGIATQMQSGRAEKFIRGVGRAMMEWTMVPDDKVGWVPFATRAALDIIRKHNIDVIYTTSAPYSAHMIGIRLARKTGLPWIADFRDPFVSSNLIPRLSPLHTYIRDHLERQWVTHATRVLTTSPLVADDFARRYSDFPFSKWVTITNGFDESDFDGLDVAIPKDQFTLRHVGSQYRNVATDPEPLSHAIRLLLDNEPEAEGRFQMIFTGMMDRTYGRQLAESIARWSLEETVHVEPPVNHQEAVRAMCNATALFIEHKFLPGSELFIRGKVFEYLRAKRPILTIIPPGALFNVLKEMDATAFVAVNDTQAIYEHLHKWFKMWQAGELDAPANSGLEKYERRVLTQALASVFDHAIEDNKRAHKAT